MSVRALSIARSVGVIGATAALIAGVTFASFQTNTVTLSGTTLSVNEIQDNLRIYDFSPGGFDTSSDDPDNVGGIDLTLTEGIESAKQRFYLQNTGESNLSIAAAASGATGSLDPTKVLVKFYNDAPSPVLLNTGGTTLANLMSTGVTFGSPDGDLAIGATGNSGILNVGQPGNYQVTFTLTSSASGTDTLTGLNLEFTGTPLP